MSGEETSRQQHVSSFQEAAVVPKRHAWGILGQSLTLRVSPISAIIEPLRPASDKASFELLLAQSSPPWRHESFWLVMAHIIPMSCCLMSTVGQARSPGWGAWARPRRGLLGPVMRGVRAERKESARYYPIAYVTNCPVTSDHVCWSLVSSESDQFNEAF
jgi:hypothetical protein